FFTELGYEVVLSDKTNDEIIHQGVEIVVAETCFPVKVAHGHVLNLLGKRLDYIFLPSLIDFEKKDSRLKRTYNCPWSQSLPYFINSVVNAKDYPVKFLEPKISLRESIEKALKNIGSLLDESPLKVKEAIKVAKRTQSQFYENLRNKGKKILSGLNGKTAFVLISRPYNGCDPGLNLDIAEKMRELGMLAIPMDFLDLDPSLISEDYSHMYWGYGQKILAASRRIKETPNLYPIYITNFGCGPDSFISKYFYEEMDRPSLELQIDEHSAEAGIITRLEAFLDSIQNKKIKRAKAAKIMSKPVSKDEDRIIYIPYMDDHSYALKAALEAMGKRAEVMETSDLISLREGQKYTTGRECYPCILTTGDMLKIINKDDFNPEKTAFFMGTAQGPCRFGQYRTFQQQILNSLGYESIPIISLDSETSYGGYGPWFTKSAWQGIAAIDILRKAQRLIRVNEVNKGETNRVYQRYRDRICEAIRNRKNLKPLMEEAATAFNKIKTENKDRPVVTIVGEIYVRHNPFGNIFIIDELERLGLKVELASMREWFMYTNQMYKEATLRERKFIDFFKIVTKNLFQEIIEKKLEVSFNHIIKGFEEPNIEEILELGERYLDRSLRGEAILTIGKTLHSIRRGRDGVVNVMPFTCMPGNITCALATLIEKDYPDFPILSLSYDGSHQANYLNKIRTFVSQVEAYHRLRDRRNQF
ncbi:MAG: acyl-CoA dehydratase activase-related protein, partial [bacterium]